MNRGGIMTGLVTAFILAVAQFSIPAQADDELIIGVDTAFVPFEFKKGDEYVGFDIDMWKEIAQEIGVKYRLQPMDFNGLIPAIVTGNIDAAIAGMSITAEREKTIDFSHPYYDSGLKLMVMSDNDEIRDRADMAGKTIAVKTGTTAAALAETFNASEVRKFPNIDQAYLELRAGRVDAAMHDTPNVLYYIKTAGEGDVKAVGPNMDAQSYGIAFPAGSELREKANIALLSMMENGRYADLYRKWFGSEPE